MYRIIFIGMAGLVGTLGRYWLSGWADERWSTNFPVGTMLVNLVGCFVIGVLFHASGEGYFSDPTLRVAVLTGLLGGFTTFSSYGVQTFNLMRDGQMGLAALNLVLSNVAGLMLVWAGYLVSRL